MIAIVRIVGKVGTEKDVEETLSRLRLRKKYTCVVISETKEKLGMVNKLEHFVAYGKIDDKFFKKIIDKRGKKIDKTKKIEEVKELKFEKANLKPFFRLHPPRGGINTKMHFPKGVLGNHKDKINELIERML